ncbi:adenylosuccinate synthetase, partial [Burkholderia sp. SIMBA_062]|uniref:adenylosuccinate synthetase n=1 Tax=Burkholderia sp. SIMBA_062 TaxID=3085803 RepID=UPI00397A4DA9
GLCITKLDVLDGLEEVKPCVGYKVDGQDVDILPRGASQVAACEPVYETFAGWKESTIGITQFDALPQSAQAYLKRV